MSREKVKISSFLAERKDRFKPEIANKLGLKRVKKIDFTGNIHLVEHKPTRTNMILVKKGDLLISGINAEKGGVAIYEYSEDAIATIHYSSYTYDESKIDIDYLKWFLKSNTFKQILIDQSGNGIKSELKPKRFLPLEINLPSLNEQKEILENLNSVNSEAEELESLITENEIFLSKLRQSILQDAVQGILTQEWRTQNPIVEPANELLKNIKEEKERLIKEKKIKKERPIIPVNKEEVPFEIPESWEFCRMQEVTTLITDGKHGNCKDEPNSGYYFLSAKDVKNGELTYTSARQINFKEFKEVHQRTNLKPGDLCIVNTGATVGKSAIVIDDEKTEKTTFQKSVAVVKVPSHLMSIYYLNNFIIAETPNLLKTSGGSAINNLLLGDMRMLKFPLPPLEEQKAIVEKIDQLLLNCDVLEQEIKASSTNAKKLMQSVLSKLLGEENHVLVKKTLTKKEKKMPSREILYNSETLLWDLFDLVKKYKKIHAEDLWKMSKHPRDIDSFYADLKVEIEEEKTIKEVQNEKGYLELV